MLLIIVFCYASFNYRQPELPRVAMQDKRANHWGCCRVLCTMVLVIGQNGNFQRMPLILIFLKEKTDIRISHHHSDTSSYFKFNCRMENQRICTYRYFKGFYEFTSLLPYTATLNPSSSSVTQDRRASSFLSREFTVLPLT